jgi:hypothetical protein
MPIRPFSFVHASDLHLDRPLVGWDEVPPWLADSLADAPLTALVRIIDQALAHRAHMLLLAGDVLHPSSGGARPWIVLAEQLERATAAGLAVYWAQGRSEAADRTMDLPLPAAVRRFVSAQVESVLHQHEGSPLVQILGQGYDGVRQVAAQRFVADPQQPCAVGLAYGAPPAEPGITGVHYWALGGQHQRATPWAAPLVHFPGTPQARRLREVGPHGCTLVEVDDQAHFRTRFLPTDTVRVQPESITLAAAAGRSDLERALWERAASLRSTAAGPHLLVAWSVSGGSRLADELHGGPLAAELLAQLRADFGRGEPGLWSLSIEPAPATAPWSLADDDTTFAGEYLRTLRHFAEHAEAPLDVDSLLTAEQHSAELVSLLQLEGSERRTAVLAAAARLGLELLAPEEQRS